jgi:hypothetical protein
MRKEQITHGSGWLLQWMGHGVTASVSSGEERMFLSLDGEPDIYIPKKYWRWLAGALAEAADKVETEDL